MLQAFIVALVGATPPAPAEAARELAPPVRIEAAGKPVDTAIGHAAPFVGDFDGDGVPDLLVGQFGDGILWIYRNEGTAAQPRLAAGVKFQEGREEGRVPSG
jgi:FG-GAP repeat